MDMESIQTTWEFSYLVINFLNQSQLLELEVLKVLIILCCKNVSAHTARNERREQTGREEDWGLVVKIAKWLILPG